MNTVKLDYVKRHTLTTLVSWVALLPMLWIFGKPAMEIAVTNAVAGEIAAQVSEGVRPVANAFIILMRRDIEEARREISALEFEKARDPAIWTALDERKLVDCRIDLDFAKEALAALEAGHAS